MTRPVPHPSNRLALASVADAVPATSDGQRAALVRRVRREPRHPALRHDALRALQETARHVC